MRNEKLDKDFILDKISKLGIQSISKEEWDFIKIQNFNLIAVDIIEGLDDNFYVVDINGDIGLDSILQHQEEFDNKLLEIFGHDDIHYDFYETFGNDSRVTIFNSTYYYENKMSWREFNYKCPSINELAKPHSLSDYPKFLIKPKFDYQARNISVYNTDSLPENLDNSYFVEQFIPSKLIDDHCYSIRVILIVNETHTYPILYLNRKCLNPIIRNLPSGKLSDEDVKSYLSNVTNKNIHFTKNIDPKLKEFVESLKINMDLSHKNLF